MKIIPSSDKLSWLGPEAKLSQKASLVLFFAVLTTFKWTSGCLDLVASCTLEGNLRESGCSWLELCYENDTSLATRVNASLTVYDSGYACLASEAGNDWRWRPFLHAIVPIWNTYSDLFHNQLLIIHIYISAIEYRRTLCTTLLTPLGNIAHCSPSYLMNSSLTVQIVPAIWISMTPCAGFLFHVNIQSGYIEVCVRFRFCSARLCISRTSALLLLLCNKLISQQSILQLLWETSQFVLHVYRVTS